MEILEFPRLNDHRGNLSFIENNTHIPFKIARSYWIYDVPGGEIRGGHAYKKLEEVIIALTGSFDVAVDDGIVQKQVYNLNCSYEGLYVPGMTWRQLLNFSKNAVALILASRPYDVDDYIYDYKVFYRLANKN